MTADLARENPESERGKRPPGGKDTQYREAIRAALDLIDNDEPSQTSQRQLGLPQARKILGTLEVEGCNRPPDSRGYGPGQRGLADLPRAQQADDPKGLKMPANLFHALRMAHSHAEHRTMKSRRLSLAFQCVR